LIKNSILKIVIFSIIVGLNWTGLSAVIETIAYYNDIENSNINTYEAGTLDFYLDSPSSNFVPLEIVSNMKAGDSVTRDISVIKETNSNSFQYNAQTVKTGGNLDFCNILKLEAKLEGKVKYSDGLMNLNLTPPIVIGADGQDDWIFTVTLPTGATFTPGEVCQIKFVFDGSQTKNDLPFGQGFNDTEEITSSFAAGGIKINKVYYDVDAEHGSEPGNEWIEIYNPLDNPVDISGWTIADSTSTDTIPTSAPIPAHGFAIITGSDTTWDYWEIPNDIIKIVLTDGEIGNGLDNDSDRVMLKLPSGTIDDAMSYGTDTSAFDPPCPDVAEGHILARVPTGVDTDTASDWHDLGLPQVTVIWPDGGEVLYVGQTDTLQWTATNPNGTDTALTIDIWYSRDSGSTWANIVKGTENDGAYDWRIPLFIGSYYVPSHHARIKVVAYGPENFMMQAWDMSNADFCPPIDYSLLTEEEKAQVEQLLTDGILTEADIINRDIMDSGEATTTDDGTTTEDVATTTEEIATTTEETSTTTENQEGGIIDQINEAIDSVINDIVEEILPDESANEEIPTEDAQVIDETATIEEMPTVEEPVIEEVPAVEEQPVITPPENNSGEQAPSADNSGGGGDGGSGDGSSSDAGSSGDSVSVAPSE